jgi:glycosyltransferase involved in cell wall biosynthesis
MTAVSVSPGSLLVFNLATDADDPILGFTTGWLRALASRWERVDVVTMRTGRIDLPANVTVHSLGKELGYSEPRRAARFYAILFRLLNRHRYEGCFAHMAPLFAAMAAPLLKARGIRTVLWYAHPAGSLVLRVAEKLVDRVFTTAPETFPYTSGKVLVTGQGIDTRLFTPAEARSANKRFSVLSVGRIAPVKRLEVLVEALGRIRDDGFGAKVTFIGPVLPGDEGYAARLRRRITEAGLQRTVKWTGPVPPQAMPNVYRRGDVLVSTTATGSGDKSVLEAMSCGIPVVAANEVFARLVRAVAPEIGRAAGEAQEVADRLREVRALSEKQRRTLGQGLRELVIRHHSLDHFVDQVVVHLRARSDHQSKVTP